MFALAKILLALFVLSVVLDAVFAAPTGLALSRRKCSAKKKAASSSSTPSPATASAENVAPSPTHSSAAAKPSTASKSSGGCFPSANFKAPSGNPTMSPSDWWCPQSSEYAFMGFSFPVNDCPSKSTMVSEFTTMRTKFGARYVRIYASCDNDGFYDDVVDAAYQAHIGVFSLVWFGFNGDDSYKGRMASLLSTIKNNPLAPYVIRTMAIGSEPLFDNAISAGDLASTINSVKGQVSKYGIQVSTSDMAYKLAGAPDVLAAVDHVESNTLPFFAGNAGWGGDAWGAVNSDLQTYASHAPGKKVYLTENGWPSNTDVWQANSAGAVASVGSEQAYYDLLDSKCETFKSAGPHGGVAWFAHVYSDDLLSGWGVTNGGQPKFHFKPRTSC